MRPRRRDESRSNAMCNIDVLYVAVSPEGWVWQGDLTPSGCYGMLSKHSML
jgi:hypothetical protein